MLAFILAAATLAATPATLDATLSAAQPGDTITLAGTFGRVVLRRPAVTLDASGATMSALEVYADDVTVRGGTVDAGDLNVWRAGMVRDAKRVRIEGATFTRAITGITVMNSRDVTLFGNVFEGLRSDCIDLAGAPGAMIEGNLCRGAKPITATFDPAGKMLKDGDHPDCVQIWPLKGYPSADITIRGNVCAGDMQGVFSNGRDGDGTGSDRITIEGNTIRNTYWQGIGLSNARGLIVRGNRVGAIPGTVRFPGGAVQSRINIQGDGNTVCGNTLADPRGSMAGATDACR